MKKYASADKIPDSALPISFDWRNIKGVDFTKAVRDQEGCGSCHIHSFVEVVESRLQLKYGKPMP